MEEFRIFSLLCIYFFISNLYGHFKTPSQTTKIAVGGVVLVDDGGFIAWSKSKSCDEYYLLGFMKEA